MKACDDDGYDEEREPVVPDLTVDWSEPTPVGRILGPDGSLAVVVYPSRRPFGFHGGAWERSPDR